jgi:V/A-type H+-transporting ATPase subunit A
MLNEESELEEIVRLVGMDALSYKDRLTMEVARSIREDYLHQNAFDEVDTYTSAQKQIAMLKLILSFDELGQAALKRGAEINDITRLPVREQIGRAKYLPERGFEEAVSDIEAQLENQMAALGFEGGLDNA